MFAQTPAIILYYVHDPMCSWCWGFKQTLAELIAGLPAQVQVRRVLGGLAPDNQQPMDEEMRGYLQQGWRRIEENIHWVKFNFDFWRQCIPRRSTYPACRAVIAARQQGEQYDELMTEAIQNAYYTQARNPSDDSTLIELAEELDLDVKQFIQALNAETTQLQLQTEIEQARELHAESFPSLVLQSGESSWSIPVDYINSKSMLQQIKQLLEIN